MSLSIQQRERFEKFVTLWARTPYMGGCQCPGPKGGVDCLRYIDAGLSAVLQPEKILPELPRKAQDCAYHDETVIHEICRLMQSRHDMEYVKSWGHFRALDVLAARMVPGMHGSLKRSRHLFLVGPSPKVCYHAVPAVGVVPMGVGALDSCYEITAVFRSNRCGRD